MKRLHVHVAVRDLENSVRFYSDLFAAPPTVLRPDYAKWMLDDPRVNFAISARGVPAGLDHLGVQTDSADELAAVHDRLARGGHALLDKGAATCCYARSDKAWVVDPQGLAWETFFTHGEHASYSEDAGAEAHARLACCAAADRTAAASVCC